MRKYLVLLVALLSMGLIAFGQVLESMPPEEPTGRAYLKTISLAVCPAEPAVRCAPPGSVCAVDSSKLDEPMSTAFEGLGFRTCVDRKWKVETGPKRYDASDLAACSPDPPTGDCLDRGSLCLGDRDVLYECARTWVVSKSWKYTP